MLDTEGKKIIIIIVWPNRPNSYLCGNGNFVCPSTSNEIMFCPMCVCVCFFVCYCVCLSVCMLSVRMRNNAKSYGLILIKFLGECMDARRATARYNGCAWRWWRCGNRNVYRPGSGAIQQMLLIIRQVVYEFMNFWGLGYLTGKNRLTFPVAIWFWNFWQNLT